MKKGYFAVAAMLLITVAIITVLLVFNVTNLNFNSKDENLITNTYEISEDFENLYIDAEKDDISFVVSEDGKCKVVCKDYESMTHSAKVNNNKLEIIIKDKNSGNVSSSLSQIPKTTVYLPKSSYLSLTLKGTSGDVEIPKDFNFDNTDIFLSSGDIQIKSLLCKGDIKIEVSSGNVLLDNISCNTLFAKCSSGDIRLKDVKCTKLETSGYSGNLTMEDVYATELFNISRSSGKIKFDECDAKTLNIKTSSGRVSGSLLSGKTFITETSSGYVNIPKTDFGGKCTIVTGSGDINIKIED